MFQMPRPFGSRGGAERRGPRGRRSPWRSQQRPYYRRDRGSPGRAEREAEAQDARARGMDVEGSQPREGPGRDGLTVKPEDPRAEHSPSPAPGDTAPHPAEASLWEQFLARGNHAEARRRVEQHAGAAGIDGMSESAGRNRHGDADERAVHRGSSDSRWPRPCVGDPRGRSEALDRGRCGPGYGAAKSVIRGADVVLIGGRPYRWQRYRERPADPALSENLSTHRISMCETRESPRSPVAMMAGRAARGRPRP